MGLAFLNKKSWHTGSFKNIEEVWKAKEKQLEQQRKREEIRKKVVEEKYSEDLKKMQVEAGLLPASSLNRMEWMYSAHEGEDKNNAEAYLLGKAVHSLADTAGALKAGVDADDQACEDFVRLVEDPLYVMARETERRRRELLANPVKMRDLFGDLRQLQAAKQARKLAKRAKKEKKEKKEKKDKKDKKEKKHKKERTRSSSSSRSRSRSRSNRKERKDKKEGKGKKHRRDRSSSSESSESKNERHAMSGKSAREAESTTLNTSEDEVFNDFVRQRLGPLVEFDPDSYRLKFTAKHRFKTNADKPEYSQAERERMVAQMKQDAEAYEREKLARYERDLQGEVSTQVQGQGQQATGVGGSLSANLNRGRYFHDKQLARD